MIDRGKHNLIGVHIHAVDYEQAVQRIVEAAKSPQPLGVSALAVHGVMTGALDPQHRYRLNQLAMVVPDGQPVRWGLNLLHRTKLKDRVYGPNLMLDTCEAAAREKLPIYLFGSSGDVLDALEVRLTERFADLIIAGKSPSKFGRNSEAENQTMLEMIKTSGARIVFVGLGCPRQEIFVYENVEALGCPTLAVGAAFDFHAGLLSQAPAWMQRRGLEWFYRLTQEPRRLWKRYLYLNPMYLCMLFGQWVGLFRPGRRPDEPPQAPERYG